MIAIIAILASLLLAGVMGVFGKGYEAGTQLRLLGLNGAALSKFYEVTQKFYPPSAN